MGVQDIFGPTANFTGIVSNEYLRVGNIIQNAKIEVDEEGTIAAAVTGNYHCNLIRVLSMQRSLQIVVLMLIKLQNLRLYRSWLTWHQLS